MGDMADNPTTAAAPALLTVRETAARLGVSIWTVYELLDSGRLQGCYQGRKRYASPAAIDAYVKSLSDLPEQP